VIKVSFDIPFPIVPKPAAIVTLAFHWPEPSSAERGARSAERGAILLTQGGDSKRLEGQRQPRRPQSRSGNDKGKYARKDRKCLC